MTVFKRLTVVWIGFAVLAVWAPQAQARNRDAEKLVAQGRQSEAKKDWDGALDLYQKALALDPSDPEYRLLVDRTRFQAGQAHLDNAMELRSQGQLDEALAEFQKALAQDPSSGAAVQEIRQTQEMIQREKEKEKAGLANSEERGLTPAQMEKRREQERIKEMLPVPELRALNPQPINIKMNNQQRRVLFETVGKLAGINVLFDPDYATGSPVATKPLSIELTNATLEEALDYLAVVTKSFWKPLSANTIFVTDDSVTKRRDYEEQVAKVFYLSNVNTPQELQEIITTLRQVTQINSITPYNPQSAIIVRGEADRVALAEKILADLDKPRAEVVVDLIVMSTSKNVTRNLAASLAPNGLKIPLSYNPRPSIRTGTASTDSAGASTASTAIPLSNITKWATADYAVTLPDGLLQAVLSDSGTRVLQAPELRSQDSQKATVKIGDRQPIASGSFQPGIGGVGINPLVNTQFQFLDVGVNVEITPKVHDNGDVSLHVDLDVSAVRDHVNLGGIDQPVISQNKATHDIRLRDGQVSLLAGLVQTQDSKTMSGIPILSSIPLLKYLFSNETVTKSQSELLIALIPHIVRRPEITEDNLKAIAVGNATVVKINYAPKRAPVEAGTPQPTQQPAAAPTPVAPAPASVPETAPAPGAPPAAAPPGAPPLPSLPGLPGTPPPPGQAPAQVPQAAAAPTAGAVVAFVPARVESVAGANIELSLVLENATDLAAAPMQIRFDPKVLRMTDVVKGELMGIDGQQVIYTKNILNDTGTVTINLNRMPGTGGVNGSGRLVTMMFQAVGSGVTTISVPQFTARNSQGQPLVTGSPLAMITVK